MSSRVSSRPDPQNYAQCSPGVLSYVATFFDLVGGMPSLMREESQIVIEVVLGEMTGTLESLRYGLIRENQKHIRGLDPRKFPDRYDGIDLSNIPDYVGGALTTFLHGVPLLRVQGASSRIRSYALRNLTVWVTHDRFLAEYLLLADSRRIKSHFRTALKERSVHFEQFLSGQLIGGGGCVMVEGFEWERGASVVESRSNAGKH
ncbi:hypothetical protein ACRE_072100 [Hapsidospora chrysogenum ATCC 11550]|uniref:Uncharacterized protein n=1 Tax=Hapsidospora chrysogenum (strain ATCC 11550 / CBS 779.69 / DSM 880 / IAM 14645 / JCM 23072 / IMI 49137) TaxID=857340 RepID=A0A086SY86_HAPC1|nr:hypothetical protein ACRE_072100 [Hapsidospora chrysogenum ATCC 11550]